MQVLTVHAPFGDFRRGDIIKDPDQVKKFAASHRHAVTLTEVPDHFFLSDGEAHDAAKAAKAAEQKAKA